MQHPVWQYNNPGADCVRFKGSGLEDSAVSRNNMSVNDVIFYHLLHRFLSCVIIQHIKEQGGLNMYRLIDDYLAQWHEDKYRKPLVIQGARQVGKTYAVLEFGRKHYDNVAYFNF